MPATAPKSDATKPHLAKIAESIKDLGVGRFYRQAVRRSSPDGTVNAAGLTIALAAKLAPDNASNYFRALCALGLAEKVRYGHYRVFRV